MQRSTVYFIWKLPYMFRVVAPPIIRSAKTVSITSGICHYGVTNTKCCIYSFCAPDDGWCYHPKHVGQFPDKKNCVTLHLVGHTLEHSYDARTHER